MKKFYCILILLLFTKLALFAQSVTIDYTNPGLGSSCNVFTQASNTNDHSVTYQNLKHQTTFGKSRIATFDVSGITSGIYYLKIFDGQKWEGKQLSIQ